MVLTQIGVRTAYDKEQEAREEALLEAIARENKNPFQHAGDLLCGAIAHVYTNYLYTSGALLLCWSWWGLYPSYARFRHRYLMRFTRRRQVEFRRAFFYTRHIPKWDKQYLQRIEMPSSSGAFVMKKKKKKKKLSSWMGISQALPHMSSSSLVKSEEKDENNNSNNNTGMMTMEHQENNEKNPIMISVTRTAGASFAGGAREKLESDVAAGIQQLNNSLQQQMQEGYLPGPHAVDPIKLQQAISQLIHESHGVVVLKETHQTRRAIAPHREVWWVSLEEARRRREWWFWLKILIIARILQDLLDMPDMPDFVQ